MKIRRVEVRVNLSWHQCVEALVRCFEVNAETAEVFAKRDAEILRHVADMIDDTLRDSAKNIYPTIK